MKMSPHLSIYWNRSSLIKVQLNDNNDEWRMIYSIKENKRNVHKNSRVGLLKSHLRIVVFSLNWLIKLIKSSKKLQKPTEPSLVIYYIFIRWNNVALFSSSTKWMRPKKKKLSNKNLLFVRLPWNLFERAFAFFREQLVKHSNLFKI